MRLIGKFQNQPVTFKSNQLLVVDCAQEWGVSSVRAELRCNVRIRAQAVEAAQGEQVTVT